MTRSHLTLLLAQRHPEQVQKDVNDAIKQILNAMAHALQEGNRIEIRGFGSFSVRSRRARIGRNPKTGEKVSVPQRRSAHFRASKELSEHIQR